MKRFILAALAMMSLGLGVANAATTNTVPTHKPNYYNFLEGGD